MRQTPTQQTQQQCPRTTENPTPSPSSAGGAVGLRLAFAIVLPLVFSLSVTSCKNGSSGSEASEGCDLEGCKIVAPDPDDADTFGSSVATDGDRLVVGAIVDDPGTNAGAAYVYALEDGQWLIEQKIQHTTPVPVGNDFFGTAVAIQGERIAVGARGVAGAGAATQAGSVFIFELIDDTWTQIQRVEAPDFAINDFFGSSIDMDGDWLVIGSYLDDDNGSASGSVYVLEYDHDLEQYVSDSKLSMPFNGANDYLGFSVAIDGDILVAGAPQDNFFGGHEEGVVNVYRYGGSGWASEQQLYAGARAAGNHFGHSVDVDDEVIVVGALFTDGDEEDEGIAWVYRFEGGAWSMNAEIERVAPSDPSKSKLFGDTVAIEGNRVIVGAKKDDEEGQRAGAAYVFEYEGGDWVEQHKLTAPDATTGDYFGSSAVMSGDAIIVGAPQAGPGNDASGAAYGYEL